MKKCGKKKYLDAIPHRDGIFCMANFTIAPISLLLYCK